PCRRFCHAEPAGAVVLRRYRQWSGLQCDAAGSGLRPGAARCRFAVRLHHTADRQQRRLVSAQRHAVAATLGVLPDRSLHLGSALLEACTDRSSGIQDGTSCIQQGGLLMEHYISLFVKAVFVENMALAFFLGMCTFLAISKKVETALMLGIAVVVVQVVTVPAN